MRWYQYLKFKVIYYAKNDKTIKIKYKKIIIIIFCNFFNWNIQEIGNFDYYNVTILN